MVFLELAVYFFGYVSVFTAVYAVLAFNTDLGAGCVLLLSVAASLAYVILTCIVIHWFYKDRVK